MHGSAPDIAGQDVANPIATVASFAMALRYSFDMGGEADLVEKAIAQVLDKGLRTGDIMQDGCARSRPAKWARRSSSELESLAG